MQRYYREWSIQVLGRDGWEWAEVDLKGRLEVAGKRTRVGIFETCILIYLYAHHLSLMWHTAQIASSYLRWQRWNI